MADQENTGGSDFLTVKSKLDPPKRSPMPREKRKLVGIPMGWLVNYVMNNFLYTFREKKQNKKQGKGAPIGDILSQEAARTVGNEFDEIFEKNMKQ